MNAAAAPSFGQWARSPAGLAAAGALALTLIVTGPGCGDDGPGRALVLLDVTAADELPAVKTLEIVAGSVRTTVGADDLRVGGEPLKIGVYLGPKDGARIRITARARDARGCPVGEGVARVTPEAGEVSASGLRLSATRAVRILDPSAGASTGGTATDDAAAANARPLFRWTTMFGATHYEIEIDDACVRGTLDTCEFATPSLTARATSTSWRPEDPLPGAVPGDDPTVHVVRVRACMDGNVCCAWSTPRAFVVGAEVGDGNGDDFGDLAIGAPGHGDAAGRVWILPGGTPPGALTSSTGAAGERLGTAFSWLGDLDGDGRAELAVGAPGAGNGRGRVVLWRGGPDGPTPWHELQGPDDLGGYGASLDAGGDVDGDGYRDLVVGAPGAGAAFLVRGGPMLLGPGVRLAGGAPDDGFGTAVAIVGDLDGDGRDEIAVGAPAARAGAGRVLVYRGGAPPDGAPDVTLDAPDGTMALGVAITGVGDLDGDGFADLAIGATGTDTSPGTVGLYLGGPAGAITSVPERVLAGVTNGGAFGAALSSADLARDGTRTLLVGAPGGGMRRSGRAYLFADPWNDAAATATVTPVAPDGADTGHAVAAVGDLDADGRRDLAIGAPGLLPAGAGFAPAGAVQVLSADGTDLTRIVAPLSATDGSGLGWAVR